jgi:hypothetical protein
MGPDACGSDDAAVLVLVSSAADGGLTLGATVPAAADAAAFDVFGVSLLLSDGTMLSGIAVRHLAKVSLGRKSRALPTIAIESFACQLWDSLET